VRPFVEGLTLRQFVARARGPVAIHQALWISRQIAEGLLALHGAGWLHGEIRPEHIIVSPQGQATLLDFSLCRRLESEECAAGPWQGAPLAYASPESLRTHARLTLAVDTYGLGLVLHEMLTGQPPFAGANETQLAALHRGQAPADIRGQRPDASPELAHLLRQILAKEPLRRPSDQELVRWLTELEIAALL
jgi:serine/threonine-protein kinase